MKSKTMRLMMTMLAVVLAAELTAVQVSPSETARADEMLLCEYMLGDATFACGRAFLYSPAARTQLCKLKVEGGFPRWTDNGHLTVDPDTMSESAQRYFGHPSFRAVASRSCQCDIRLACKRLTFGNSNGWIAVPSGYTYDQVQCSSSDLESLRTMTGTDCPN